MILLYVFEQLSGEKRVRYLRWVTPVSPIWRVYPLGWTGSKGLSRRRCRVDLSGSCPVKRRASKTTRDAMDSEGDVIRAATSRQASTSQEVTTRLRPTASRATPSFRFAPAVRLTQRNDQCSNEYAETPPRRTVVGSAPGLRFTWAAAPPDHVKLRKAGGRGGGGKGRQRHCRQQRPWQWQWQRRRLRRRER